MMKKTWILTAALALATVGFAADEAITPPPQPKLVSVSAKGDDVRSVLHGIFAQAEKNYVIEPGIRFVLYLSLSNVELDEALEIICRQANIEYKLQNGITFITPKKVVLPAKPDTPPVEIKPIPAPPKPLGTLPKTVLDKRFTTRLNKASIRDVFKAIGAQTQVKFEIDDSVPNWKLDAFLIDTSVKYALDLIAKQAGLEYRFTDRLSIEIRKPDLTPKEENRITVFRD